MAKEEYMANRKQKEDGEKPLYLGHRKRLKKRFLTDEGRSMPDYEILELLLTAGIMRKDVKDLAKNLLSKFGTLAKVLNATVERLRAFGLRDNTITYIKLAKTLMDRCSWQNLKEKEDVILNNFDKMIEYCCMEFGHKSYEEVHAIFLDSGLKLITSEILQSGSSSSVAVSVDEIVRRALNTNSGVMILVHNHPAGKARPSSQDIAFTKRLYEAFEFLQIKFFDHIIVTEDAYYSFRENGLIFNKS